MSEEEKYEQLRQVCLSYRNDCDKKDHQISELQAKVKELRKIHSIKDDVSRCEIVNGVKFNAEQIMIVELLKHNYEMRINMLNQHLTDKQIEIDGLEQQLDQANERLPKFKRCDFVYAFFSQTEIYKGQIDAFDYYTNSYLVFPNEDVGNEWIEADRVFKTKSEAKQKIQELRGGG